MSARVRAESCVPALPPPLFLNGLVECTLIPKEDTERRNLLEQAVMQYEAVSVPFNSFQFVQKYISFNLSSLCYQYISFVEIITFGQNLSVVIVQVHIHMSRCRCHEELLLCDTRRLQFKELFTLSDTP